VPNTVANANFSLSSSAIGICQKPLLASTTVKYLAPTK